MSDRYKQDIGDDEIRIISGHRPHPESISDRPKTAPQGKPTVFWVLLGLIVIGILGAGWFFLPIGSTRQTQPPVAPTPQPHRIVGSVSDSLTHLPHTVLQTDTTIRQVALMVFTPQQATPTLSIGQEVLSDTTAMLVVPAADVREDNGEIVGAYVVEGNLRSRGKSKAGFCAILHGIPTIGVAEATPLLEQALETNGYFFRQYPLVVGRQVVENKPKGRSFRKALAQLNGETVVVVSRDRLTFHDFSQALVDLGVSDAIYLVGSTAYGFARPARGSKVEFGTRNAAASPNANYIVWR